MIETDPEIQEQLDKIADYIEEHGWCQGKFVDSSGAVCLHGALYRVINIDALSFELRIELNEELVHRTGAYFITNWNDAPGRTQDQVVRMLRGKDLEE